MKMDAPDNQASIPPPPIPPTRRRGIAKSPVRSRGAGLSKDPAARQRQLDALKRVNEARKNGKGPPRRAWGSRRNPELKPIGSYKEMVQAARDHSHEAINFLVAVLRHPGRALRERMLAAQILLDRGWGRAPMFVKIAGDGDANDRGAPKLTEMPREQFSREVLKILREAGEIRDSDLTNETDVAPRPVEPEV